MYDSEPVSNLVEEICNTVDSYIEYLEACDNHSEEALELGFDKDDAIIVYEQGGRLDFKVEHFKDYLHMNMGEVALSTMDRLISDGHNDYGKVLRLVNVIAGHDIPYEIVTKAEELSKENHYSCYTIEEHHKSTDESIYYQCEMLDSGRAFIIKARNRAIHVYKDIKPFAHSFIPDQVLDFLYPNSNEYTHIRYLGNVKDECIFYPCQEDTILADGFLLTVDTLVGYNEQTKKCRLITGELANRMYCKLEKDYII